MQMHNGKFIVQSNSDLFNCICHQHMSSFDASFKNNATGVLSLEHYTKSVMWLKLELLHHRCECTPFFLSLKKKKEKKRHFSVTPRAYIFGVGM